MWGKPEFTDAENEFMMARWYSLGDVRLFVVSKF